MEEQKELKFFCPYCIGEITPETTQCPLCGYVYGPDTLELLTSIANRSGSIGENGNIPAILISGLTMDKGICISRIFLFMILPKIRNCSL